MRAPDRERAGLVHDQSDLLPLFSDKQSSGGFFQEQAPASRTGARNPGQKAGGKPEGLTPRRRDCEWTYINAGEAGETTTMPIATFERRQATLVEVRLSMDALVRALKEPRRAGKSIGRSADREAGNEP